MTGKSNRLGPRRIIALALAFTVCACGSEDDDGAGGPVAVLSAFPAELAAVLEHVTVDGTLSIADRNFRLGSIGATRVVVGMTGIGLVNAATVTRALLDEIDVAGVVISGVAGSSLRIADVAVPTTWGLADGSSYAADAQWLEIAAGVAAEVPLARCTRRPTAPQGEEICMAHLPQVVVGGRGESDDGFGDNPLACQPNGGDVFGCDVVSSGSSAAAAASDLYGSGGGLGAAVDMESAAIAREVVARGLPFIAFRAVSDGEGDPLGLPGFPAQFFTYYRLAAHNAAVATDAFLSALEAAN